MLVVVGGHSRHVGKTAVIMGLIRAFPEAAWTAVKVSPHAHRAPGGDLDVTEQAVPDETDTGRFLAAGARRSFLVCFQSPDRLAPALGPILAAAANAVVETNTALEFLDPDLYLLVVNPAVEDVKPAALRHLERVTACLVHQTQAAGRWRELLAGPLADKPRFPVRPPQYVCPELVAFVRSRCGF
jgi:hypothetical protein